jgi:hypothetical protein
VRTLLDALGDACQAQVVTSSPGPPNRIKLAARVMLN